MTRLLRIEAAGFVGLAVFFALSTVAKAVNGEMWPDVPIGVLATVAWLALSRWVSSKVDAEARRGKAER